MRMLEMNCLLTIIFTLCLVGTSVAREFQFLNTCGHQVWVGIQNNPGKALLEGGGFVLLSNQRRSTYSADDWAGRFWGRTGCNARNQHCETGDCGNRLKCGGKGGAVPVSLVEISLKSYGGLDFYDISLVDGFNIPISIEPLGGQGDGSQYSCKRSSCTYAVNSECPNELKLTNGNGQTVGCKSACQAFNTDQYCCRGQYDTPETCKATDFPVNYPKFFKDRCPDAYSYAYDDHKSTFTCNAPAYLITLC